jgi:ATP-dependent Clp protease ATP-binding subunit ClpB
VSIQFKLIQRRLGENGIKIEADDKVLRHLSEIGFDPQFGARPLKRALQREILNELSKEILAGAITRDSVIGITLGDHNRIEFLNLDKVEIE